MAPGVASPMPVFVLGLDRSGTTWLANILANHPKAVAVQSDDHFGVHESIFFSHFARAYGPLADEANFRRFADGFTTSDYYQLSGLEPEWLVNRHPRSYAEAFRAMMDEVARRRGAEVWIEKSPSHTLLAEELLTAFPDARFVGIVRSPRAVIASQLRVKGEPLPSYPARLGRLLRLARDCSVHERSVRRFCGGNESCTLTTYERLAADPAAEVRRICAFIGVDYTAAMLELPWRRNTSFRSEPRPGKALNVLDRWFVAGSLAAIRAVPLAALRWQVARRQARRGVEWPPWCWRRRDAGVAP